MTRSSKFKAQSSGIKGKLIIVSAPSGAGKTTIVRHLLSCPFGLVFSVSATSRKPRKGEVNGKDYIFISPEEFKQRIDNGEFLEWQEVYPGTYYGTLKNQVDAEISKGKPVVFDVDVLGGVNIKRMFGEQALSVFIQAPSIEVLRKRLEARSTESSEKIEQRVSKAIYEMTFANQFDVILINDNLEETLKKAEKLVSDFLR